MNTRFLMLEWMADQWGIDWFDYQLEALDGEQHTDSAELRACLYFRTGAGKTYTSLALLKQAGINDALVIAPPATHAQWKKHAAAIQMTVECISHAKYRMKGTKYSRLKPIIVDEFHLLGGQGGTGWDKMRLQARGMQAPLVILSATPNYNDAERVYCVERVLDPVTKVDYVTWIYRNCETENNPFGALPKILGFADGRPAKEHLAALPHVYYVEDEHEDFPIADVELPTQVPDELEEYGIDRRSERIIASRMEYQSSSRKHQLIDDYGCLRVEVYDVLAELAGQSTKPVLVFAARAEVAKAAHEAALGHGAQSGLIHGQATAKQKAAVVQSFKDGALEVLFCTTTIGTGVDGLDTVCNMLILLDDTDDASLRRQIIGRILPRGLSSDASSKVVTRLLLGS